jgi:hypothetical protein
MIASVSAHGVSVSTVVGRRSRVRLGARPVVTSGGKVNNSRPLVLDDVQSIPDLQKFVDENERRRKLIRVRRDLKETCLRENLSLNDLENMLNEFIVESIHES